MNKKITIGICGPPSAGKTTTAQILRWKLKNSTEKSREVPREYARHYIEKYGEINNIYQQMFIYEGQTKFEKQIYDNYDITISDSPRFLAYIYAKKLFDYQNKQDRAALTRLYELALESINDYDVIYLLPPAFNVEQDGIRIQNENDANNIFNEIQDFLFTHHCHDKTKFLTFHKKEKIEETADNIINDLISNNLI